MKLIARFAFFSLVATTMAFAQPPRQVGAWSIYTTSATFTGDNMVLLQTTATDDREDTRGNSNAAKLDIICKNSKVVAIAVETGSKIDKHLISYESPVPTVRLGFSFPGRIDVSENWAVAAGGHSLSPYSQLFQGKLTHTWIGRLSENQNMVLHMNGHEGDSLEQSTFDTRELSPALSAVGCTRQ